MYKFVMDFIGLSEDPLITRIEFLGEKLRVSKGDTLTFERGEDFFNGEESISVPLKMFTKKEIFDYVINFFKDYNHSYCFLDEVGTTYELLFMKNEPLEIKVKCYNSDIKIYDTNRTKLRKRFLLVNYPLNTIDINGQNVHIVKYIHSIYKSIDLSSSYQISFYDLKKSYIVGKQITLPMDLEGVKNVFNIHYNFFTQFYNDFSNALENEKDFKFRFNKLYHTYKNDDIPKYYLNRNKIGLEDDTYKEMYIDFTFYIVVFHIYKEIMIFIINFSTARKFFNFLEIKFKQIKLDEKLKIAEKIFIIEQFPKILKKVKTLDNFTKSGITYYVMAQKEEDSILDLVEKYFFEYLNNYIQEDSRLFFRLIEILSGIGYYNEKYYYIYGMQNLAEVKNEFKKIFRNILIMYKFKNKIFLLIQNKTTTINIYIKDIKEMDKFLLHKTLTGNDFYEGKNIAAKIIVCLLHEAYGYKKFLINKLEYIPNFSNYVENEKNKGNPHYTDILIDGKDVEIFNKLMYAKIGEFTAVEIIDKINGYADFLDNYDFWQKDYNAFNDYFTYKYLMIRLNKQMDEIPMDIREKIRIIKNEINKNGINIEPYLKKEIRVTGRKRRRTKNEMENNGNDNEYEENVDYKDEDENYNNNNATNNISNNLNNSKNNSNDKDKDKEKDIDNDNDKENNSALINIDNIIQDIISTIPDNIDIQEIKEVNEENIKDNNDKEKNGNNKDEEEKEYDFKNMTYDELIKLEKSGVLKGSNLVNCRMKLMQMEILNNNIN